MKFSLIEIQYSFQVIKRFHIKKSRHKSKSLALDMHFSLMWNPYTKIKSFLDYMTKKSPDFSQKVWLLVERNGGHKWLLFFCLVSDHVKTSSQRWRVWGEEQGRARGRPGKRKCAEVCGFRGEAEERETSLLMWLSCPLLLYFSRPTLARLSLTVFVFSPVFVNQISLFEQCLCATVGTARTSLRGQSPHEWKEKESLPVRILFVFAPDCLHVYVQQIQTSSLALLFGCGSTKVKINRSFTLPRGGGQARSIFLACQSPHDMRATKSLLVLSCFCGWLSPRLSNRSKHPLSVSLFGCGTVVD